MEKSQTLFKSGYVKGKGSKEWALKIINNIVDGQTRSREFYVGNVLADGTFETEFESDELYSAWRKYTDIRIWSRGYERVRAEDLECKML